MNIYRNAAGLHVDGVLYIERDEVERRVAAAADRAARQERAECQEIAARYGGDDAENIAEMIGARNFVKS